MRTWPDAPLIRYFGWGNSDAVLINSLQAYKEVLHTQCYSFVRTTGFRRLIQDIIGVGLVFAEGEEHKRQRKVLGGNPANPPLTMLSQQLTHRFFSLSRSLHCVQRQELLDRVQREGRHPGRGVRQSRLEQRRNGGR
jgi:cytochrome P450